MRKFAAVFVSGLMVVLAGCTAGIAPGGGSKANPGVNTVKNGVIHGGQNPVSGATVQLWQVGTTGYGKGATALGSSATSLSDGSFSITGDYSCTSAANGNNTLVYITATGGSAGGGTNNQLSMMTALGTCGSLTPSTFITINEVTTVASVYALAQFMSPAGVVGSYGYSNTGLANAFATVNNLVNTSTGAANSVTPGGNGVAPSAEIYTLANIVASCVNSSSVGASPSANCSLLFAATTPTGTGSAGSTAPTTTLAAALNVALYPWYNAGATSTLFPLSPPSPPFGPALTVAPNDWTVALSFNGGGSGAYAVAIDAAGSVYTANYVSSAGTVSKLSTVGVPVGGSPFIGGGGLSGPDALAFDTSGTLWVVDHDSNQILSLNSTNGNSVAGPFQYPETNAPNAIAIDGNDNIWVTNSGGSTVSETNIQSPGSSVALSGGGVSNPFAVAIDGAGNGWIADRSASALSEFNQRDTAISPVGGDTGGGLNFPIAIAMDNAGDAWLVNVGANTLSEFNNQGTPIGSGSAIGGTGSASAVAVDGSGRVYVSKRTPLLALFNSSGVEITGTSGFQGGNMSGPDTLAIDASGNVWVGNQAPATVNGGLQTVSEFVGLATPSITPQSLAVQNGQVGLKPGTPISVVATTSVLPYYTPGAAYSAQLHASGGNTGAYTWTLASGALPTGLSLPPSGSIGGSTTVTGTTTFTVNVCDAANATNCAGPVALSLTSSGNLPTGGGESMLNGNYALRFGGFNNNINGGNNGFSIGFNEVMQLSFNGSGAITAGEYDFNNPVNHNASPIAVTGEYTLGTDHRGVMVLNIGTSHFEYALSVGNLNGSSVAQDVRFMEFDDTYASGAPTTGTGAGVGKLQSGVGTFSLAQSFVFGLQGETPCTAFNGNGCANGVLSQFGSITAIGQFTGNGSLAITGGEEDASGDSNGNGTDNNGNGYSGIALAGSYTAPDAFGRGTLTLVPTPSGAIYPAAPSHFVYYVVSPTEMYMMSTDAHANFTMLSGDVLAQTATFTGASQLSGSFVLYASDPVNGDGTSFYSNQSGANLIYLTASGSTLNGYQDSNNDNNGQLQLGQPLGPVSYALDSAGRMTLTGAGHHAPIFYMANGAQGFATEGGGAGLLTLEQQTGGPFSCASFTAGTYLLGDIQLPIRTGVTTGSVLESGTGTGTSTLDNSDPSGVLTQGRSQTVTCVADANGVTTASTGRVTFTVSGGNGSSVGYIISPTKAVLMNASPGNTAPDVIVVQK